MDLITGLPKRKGLGIQQNLSIMFHPQTDGLSKRKNQWVEQYLRAVTAAQPEDWTYWIMMATVVHNNQVNSTTGLSPSQILIGYKPSLSPSEKITTGNEAAEKQVEHMEKGRQEATKVINKKVG